MAFAATTYWEVQTGGSDTANGGGFDPSNASMATDLAATSGTGNAPVVTSASYNFAARDVGHWLYVKTGTNWTAGWYKIASVASNAATLTASVGAAVTFITLKPNTVAGVATTASPTGGTWSIDYSQGASPGIAYTDMVIAVTTTDYTSAANPVGVNVVGNVISVTSGVNFTVQRVQVLSVSGTTATCDKSLGTAAALAGNGGLGGALASPGMTGGLMVGGNYMWVKAGTYTIASATANIATGCVTLPAGVTANASRVTGYTTVRGDESTRPLLQASAISTFTIITTGSLGVVKNINVDGALLTSARGTNFGAQSRAFMVKALNCTNAAFVGTATSVFLGCEATGCTTATIFVGGVSFFCVSHDNTVQSWNLSSTSGNAAYFCIAANNTGSGVTGFACNATAAQMVGCLAYACGGSAFGLTAGAARCDLINCLAVNCGAGGGGGFAINLNAPWDGLRVQNCAGFNNTSGNLTVDAVASPNVLNFITLTADPFVNAAGNNFALNLTAGGGAALRAAGYPSSFVGLSTNEYVDVGAVQHQDTSAGLIPAVISPQIHQAMFE